METMTGRVAVVTRGGIRVIGKSTGAGALVGEGANVVLADIEEAQYRVLRKPKSPERGVQSLGVDQPK